MATVQRSAFGAVFNGFEDMTSALKMLLHAHRALLGRLAAGEQLNAREIRAARRATKDYAQLVVLGEQVVRQVSERRAQS